MKRRKPFRISCVHQAALALTLTLICLVRARSAAFSDANWMSMGGLPGANGNVQAEVVDTSGNLYIGGSFTIVGKANANYIAKWDGTNWTTLGSGTDGAVYALAISGTDLYAAGAFTNAGGSAANYVAKWDGKSWTSLGSGMNGSVSALGVSGGDIYAGGLFTRAGGSAASYIAKWNGNTWSALGGGMSGDVSALAVGDGLYAGGHFIRATNSDGMAVTLNYIGKWNGSSWTNLGNGMSYAVYALAVSVTHVYAGGYFSMAGETQVDNVAKWDGNSWTALGFGMERPVYALAISASDVYAAGAFRSAGGNEADSVAKWNGSAWTTVGSGIYNDVLALAVSGSNLYAGGRFKASSGTSAERIAKWNGSVWTVLGFDTGIGDVSVIATAGDEIYAGGVFRTAGGTMVNGVAKWDGTNWTALGSGMDNTVYALAFFGGELYAAGRFTAAMNSDGTTVPLNYIGKWNGSRWTNVGLGMNGFVSGLAVLGDDLYAGGAFQTATNGSGAAILLSYVGKWNGSSWTNVGIGMDYVVYALAASGNHLYAGGGFQRAGWTAANHVAEWNGLYWAPLGSGMNHVVYSFAVSGSNVYAGGLFTTAGESQANHIAKWDGAKWTALGSGVSTFPGPNPAVSAIAVSGSAVYAGGQFTIAGGNPANFIAKWDGSTWTPLGSGMNGWVDALAVSRNDLYAGGSFTTAGGKISYRIARAYMELPTLSILRSSEDISVSWPTSFGRFVLQQNVDLGNSNGWSNADFPINTNGAIKSATAPTAQESQFFRLIGN